MANVFVQIIASTKVRIKITQFVLKNIFLIPRHNVITHLYSFVSLNDSRVYTLLIQRTMFMIRVNFDPSKSHVLRVFRPLGQLVLKNVRYVVHLFASPAVYF